MSQKKPDPKKGQWGTILHIRHCDPYKWQRNYHMREISCAQLYSTLCFWQDKKQTFNCRQDVQTNFLILHIYNPSRPMFLHIVCALAIFHIIIHSYNHVILHEAKNVHCQPFSLAEVNKLSGILRWPGGADLSAFAQSISTITRRRRIAGTKILSRWWKKDMLCGVPKYPHTVYQCCTGLPVWVWLQWETDCYINVLQPHKAFNQALVR